ncbi:LapA family protein [Pseudarthrobacter sulfonivorans]
MSTEPAPSPDPGQGASGIPPENAGTRSRIAVTRAGMAWAATVAALILLILLIIFIVQNQDDMTVRFIGLEGTIASGVALFIAAVGGGVLVAVAGAARILQLRSRTRHQLPAPPRTDRRA